MKKKIIFQKCNLNSIYFLSYILAYIISIFINYFLYENEPIEIYSEAFNFFIARGMLEIYCINLSDFIAIIPFFIRKKLVQSDNNNKKDERKLENDNNEHKEKEKIELIYNASIQSGSQINPKKKLFYLIIIAAFDFMKEFVFILYYIISKEKEFESYPFNFTVIFDIILQFVFSYLILKIHFERLQHFSLYLNVIILVIILSLDLVDILKEHIIKNGLIYIVSPFYLTFFCLEYVYGKKVILYGFISIYLLIIIKGVVKLIFVIVFSIIVLIVKKQIFVLFASYFLKAKCVLLIIGKIITNFFNALSLWIIIDKFSPNHTPLILIGEEICNFVADLIGGHSKFKDMKWHKYIRIVLYVISFIGVMLHNEIVVINICGLGSDTKYFLDMMVKEDEEYSTSDDPDILKRFETLEMIEVKDGDSVTN